jgi:glucosamine--fructose-6-phosphate aminotransferase (isomerizing)
MNLSRVMSTASRRMATVSITGRSSVANVSQRGFIAAAATQHRRNPDDEIAYSSRLGGLLATAAAAMGASIAFAKNEERADCCGIAGVVGGSGDAREFLLEGLTILKNRGYDSAGIATIGDPKDGLVSSKTHAII